MLKDQLRKARKAAGKTQRECADHIGVNFSTYSCYETGKREPDALKIKKLAAFLGVTTDFLLRDGSVASEDTSHTPIICQSRGEEKLILAYRALDNERKSAAISAVKKMGIK